MARLLSNLHVECAFTTSPDDPSPSWTDITPYVRTDRAFSMQSHGRPDEYGQPQPTTAAFALKNTDGRFTAGLTTGAYYPNVKLRKKIRAYYDDGVNPRSYRFTGYIEEWPTEWPGGSVHSEVQVTAVDRFKRMGQLAAFRSIIEEEYKLDAPFAHYTLGDASGSTQAGDVSANGRQALATAQLGSGGTLDFGTATGPGTDGLTALTLTPTNTTNGKYLSTTLSNDGSNLTGTMECFFSTSTAAAQSLMSLGNAGFFTGPCPVIADLGINASGKLTANTRGAVLTSSGSVADGLTHHAAVVWSVGASTTFTLYLDGVQVGTDTTSVISPNLWTGSAPFRVGGIDIPAVFGTSSVFNGVIAHAAVYNTAVSVTRLLAHYNAGANGFSGERSDQRIARYASYVGIPTAEQDLETGLSTSIAHVDITGKAPLTAMQDVAATEGGVLFIAGDGKLTFHARSHRYNATSEATLAHLDPSTKFVTNDALLVNDVTASRDSGINFRATNAQSITDYGTSKGDVTLLTTSDNEVVDAANWKANSNAQPTPRLPGLPIEITGASPTVQQSVLALEVGSRVTVGSLPATAPFTSTDQFIEGWSESWSDQRIGFNFNTSPAATSGVWVLDSATHSQLDVSTRLAY